MGPYDKRKGKTMEKIFKLKENGTTVRTEILAGLTTFMTMAYIIALNPNLLTGFAVGTPLWNGVFLATCIASAIGTACMAFLANKPFAMAPGMGLNSFFAVVVANIAVINDCDYTSAFQAALVIILIEGIVFLVLTVLKVREKIVEAIPLGVRYGIAPAIGLMLMNVGLGSNIGIYSENGGPFYMMRDFFGALTPSIIKGNMGSGYDTMVLTVVTAFLGVFVMVVLAKKGIKAAVLLGMLFSSVLYWIGSFAFLGVNPFASLETASFVPPFADMVSTTLFKFDFAGFMNIGWFTAITLIITFCMIDMFDTIGTLVGTASRAGMVNEKGEMPNIFNPEFAGGCLMDINFYNLYLNIALFGKPQSAMYYPNIYPGAADTSGIVVMNYDGFVSESAGAKDTWGVNFFQIEGETGYIYVAGGSNGLAEVRVVTKTSDETINHQSDPDRWFYEVQNLTALVLADDYAAIEARQDVMLNVMEVLETVRRNAGIRFPGDR